MYSRYLVPVLGPNPEPAIFGVNSFASDYSQIYSKHVLCLDLRQMVYLVQSEPKFTD